MRSSNGNGVSCGIVHTEHLIHDYGCNDYNSLCGVADEAMRISSLQAVKSI